MAVVINTITNSEKLSLINNNFTKLAAAINQSLVWRNGDTAGETGFTRDLDMNGYQILNAYVGTHSLTDMVDIAYGASESAASAAASAVSAASSATSASESAASAAASAEIAENLTTFTQEETGATGRTYLSKLRDEVSVKDFGAVGDGSLHLLSEKYSTLSAAQAQYPFVSSLSQSLDWAGIQAALNTGKAVRAPKGDYYLNFPLTMTTIGQHFFGDGRGYGYGEKDEWWETFTPETRLIATGTYPRRLLTRRLSRLSSTDATDTLMSAALEVHAEGAQLYDLSLWLDCDYSDTSPTNYGQDVDIGVFTSSRCGVYYANIGVFGYFRKGGIVYDVTRAPGDLPELLDPYGASLPEGIPFHGGDGTTLVNPYVRGARVAVGVIGAIHSDSGYWNENTASLVTDTRGQSGFSDFQVFGGRLYAGYHHSGYRLADPSVTPLTRTAMEAEDIYSPACLVVDGWSTNATTTTHGVGAIRGMMFYGLRFTSPEMFRVRLRQCDEVYFVGRTWIEGGTGTTYNTSGTVVSVSDYTNNTYGHISGDSTLTGSVYADHVTGGIFQTWISGGKWAGRNAFGTERVRGVYNQADSSLLGSSQLALSEIRDLASSPTKFTQLVAGFIPSSVLWDVSSGGYASGWVNDTAFMDLCYATSPSNVAALKTNVAYRLRVADGLVELKIPHRLPSYTVATLPSAALTLGAGFMVYCSDGDGGSGCLAVNSGGVWYRVSLDSTVSTTLQASVGSASKIKTAVYSTAYRFSSTVGHFSGSGSPEGSLTAGIGSLYSRTDGGTSTSLYVKESGTGNTGWIAK